MAEGEEGREAEVTSYLALVAQIIPRQYCDYLPFKFPPHTYHFHCLHLHQDHKLLTRLAGKVVN